MIGITCGDGSRIFNNGLHQNAYTLFNLYKKQGVDVVLCSENKNDKKVLNENIITITDENINKFSTLIEISSSISDYLFSLFKGRTISVNYGNIYMSFIENIATNKNLNFSFPRQGVESWISPHFMKSNYDLINVLTREKVVECPYIWSNDFIDLLMRQNGIDTINKNRRQIGIFEPNLSFIKNAIIPTLALEILERANPEAIEVASIFCSEDLSTSKKFMEIISYYDIKRKRKLTFESRHITVKMLSKYVGTVVSHHIENDLNYLLLECLYLNVPIIHNSNFCKDSGYHYEGFDAKEAANQIESAIYDFDEKKYKEKNIGILSKYSDKNIDNITKYMDMLNP